VGTEGLKSALPSALVIAFLMVTITAFVISTIIVSAPSTFSASPGATLSPTSARANTRIKFTVTVTNDYAADNIDNVIIMSPGFSQPIGYKENLVIAGDNIENAVAHLRQAGENLKKAEDNKKSAGPDVKYAGDNLQAPTQDDWRLAAFLGAGSSAAADNAWAYVENAGSNLVKAADAIDNRIENLDYIYTYLYHAGTDLINAAGAVGPPRTSMENFDDDGADNVRQTGENLRSAASSLRYGDLETAGLRLLDAGGNLIAAGASLDDLDPELVAVGTAGSILQTAGNKLVDAGNFLDNAGYALGVAENYLKSAGENLYGSSPHLRTAGTKLKIAASYIENAGIALYDNVPRAGENLKLAAENLENFAGEIGVALGGDEENAAATDLKQAAENLRTRGRVDITTAGEELISAASNLNSAGSKLESTASDLQPTTWNISTITNGVRFDAIGDNIIAPGASRTFVFLWTTPNITTQTDYMISVLVSKEEAIYTTYENLGGFNVTIDGRKPTLIIYVTQVGVEPKNVVGTALDSARATIHIFSSESLLSIENIYVENSGGTEENFLPPIENTALTKIDDTHWRYDYITVGSWDDNVVVVRVSRIKDLAGHENTNMENTITVDTRAPIFIDNGLSVLITGVRKNVVQAGTGTVFRYVDNSASEYMVIRVEDNKLGNADNAKWVTSVTIDTTAATRDPTQDNRWTKSITLSEGFNSIVKVTATDRVGNSKSDNIENIFIDTRTPTIAFTTVAGKTWDENSELINDNTPEIKITVLDPGYPTGGLGVAYKVGSGLAENFLWVGLDNDDNIYNIFPAVPYGRLENKATWVVSTGIFENLIDNAGKGLKDGTYWIVVMASDNMTHLGKDNVVAARSFTIDTTIVRGVDVSISPEYQENLPGETVNYTVTITNTGNVDDNYNLTASDNESWNLGIAPSITVPAFENRTTMLTVTIPENANGGTEDNIIVNATSQVDNTVSDNDSCIAHTMARMVLPPTDDSYVDQWHYPDRNYGGKKSLLLRSLMAGGVSRNQRIFMKFDLSSIPSDMVVKRAKLWLYCYRAGGGDMDVQACAVDNDNWGENTITWDNQPAYGATVGSTTLYLGQEGWYSLDITSFARGEHEGNKKASLCLKALQEDSKARYMFRSKEYGVADLRPYLEVYWAPSWPPEGAPATISLSGVPAIGFADGIPTYSGIENIYIMQHKTNSYDNTENLSGHENLQVYEGNTAVIEGTGLPPENIPHENAFDIVVAVKGHTDNMAYVVKENMYVRLVISGAISDDENTLGTEKRYVFEDGTPIFIRVNHVFDNDGNGYTLNAGENIDLTVYYYCYK